MIYNRHLIVDDAQINRYIIKRYLLKYNTTFIIDEAMNAESSVNYAKNNDYDIIFMDIKMPGKYDGIEASKLIREFKPNQTIYGFTGQVEEKNIKTMNRIIEKPTSRQEILKILDEYYVSQG